MVNLILDCSCGMNVYVLDGEKVYSKIDSTQNKHSDEILDVIDELLQSAQKSIGEVDNICVCVGPGSFTGVRVAISLAKGLSIGCKAKIFTLSNFDVFDITKKDNSVLVLDGFSTFVYVRKFFNDGFIDECVDLNLLKNYVNEKNCQVFVTNEKTQNLLNKFEISPKLAKNNIISAFKNKINKDEFVMLNQIYPVYLRASQAEIEREKKQNNG